jgi:hypothetical protein
MCCLQVFDLEYDRLYGPGSQPDGSSHPMWYPPFSGSVSQAFGWQSMYLMQKLVETSLSPDWNTIVGASYRVSTPSMFHQASFDRYGRTELVNEVLQQQMPVGYPNVVAPINIASPLVYPLPTWEERTFDPQFYARADEQVMVACNTFAILLCVILLAMVLHNSHSAVIRATTVSFSLVVILGGILMLTSSYFATLMVNDAHCAAQVWLLTLGWTAMYSALFLKTFRIWRIFGVQHLSVVKLKDHKLLLALSAFFLVDLLINIVWAATAGITSTRVQVDVYRPSLDFRKCDYSSGGIIAVILHLIIKGGMLLFGVFLAWGTRKAPSMFNDSTVIAAALYNTFVVCSFILPIIAVQLGGRSTTYLVRAFAIMFLVLSTLGLLYVPKLLLLFGWSGELHKLAVDGADTIGQSVMSPGKPIPSAPAVKGTLQPRNSLVSPSQKPNAVRNVSTAHPSPQSPGSTVEALPSAHATVTSNGTHGHAVAGDTTAATAAPGHSRSNSHSREGGQHRLPRVQKPPSAGRERERDRETDLREREILQGAPGQVNISSEGE